MIRKNKPKRHRLTEFIEVLKEKSNEYNRFAICSACKEARGHEFAYSNKFVNTKRLVKSHLKNCMHFKNKKGEDEAARILDDTDREKNNKKKRQREYDSNEESSNDSDQNSTTEADREYKGPLDFHVVHALSKARQSKFEYSLLKMTVANGWSFRWVENPDSLAPFKLLNPKITLPTRKQLSGRILDKAVSEFVSKIKETAKKDIIGITVTLDGWTNVINQNLLGSVLITSSGKPLIWKAQDVSSERSRATDIISKIGELFNDLESEEIRIIALVTDSAAAYTSAKKQLQINHKNKIFLPCFAHQLNLCVGEIFKESPIFKQAIDDATIIATYFRNINHTYFIGKLREQQEILYYKYVTLIKPGVTRWNSYFYCLGSLLKTKEALKTLVAKYEPRDHDSNDESSSFRNTSDLVLPGKICNIINDDAWWRQIKNIKSLLLPYCSCLNLLQRDKARLFEVLHSFGYLVQMIKEYPDTHLGQQLLGRLEKQWSSWEQPLLILSFVLHPMYQMEKFNSELENLTWVDVGEYILYYYSEWFNQQPNSILRELELFRQKKSPFNNATSRQFGNDVIGYWSYCASRAKELGLVALRIHGICINSASVERLWSSMGFIHSNRRNRLPFKKALAISQLRGILTQDRRIQEMDKLKKLYESTSTTFLLNHSEDVSSTLTVQDTNDESDYIEIDDASEEEDTTFLSSISDEDSDENNSLSLESTDLNELLDDQECSVGRKVKWPLTNLFLADLEPPFFASI